MTIKEDDVERVRQTYAELGSQRKTAEALGLSLGAVQRRLAKPEGASDSQVIKSVTYYDSGDGKLKPKWVKTESDDSRQAIDAYHQGLLQALAAHTPIPENLDLPPSNLMHFLPIGDLHLAMLAWGQETQGADWDLNIAVDLYKKIIQYLIGIAGPGHTLVVAPLGDFLHVDGHIPLTPASKNLLDTDTRFGKLAPTAIECLDYPIRLGLQKYKHVHVIPELGNHDPDSTIWLRAAFDRIYRDEPRVTVDTAPAMFHYYQWGRTLVATHHGHKVKLNNLDRLMAYDVPQMWASSIFRYWWTGHVHHDQVKDLLGCKAESVRVIPPCDAFAANAGYRSQRDNKLIVYHPQLGELSRHTAPVEMFQHGGNFSSGLRG